MNEALVLGGNRALFIGKKGYGGRFLVFFWWGTLGNFLPGVFFSLQGTLHAFGVAWEVPRGPYRAWLTRNRVLSAIGHLFRGFTRHWGYVWGSCGAIQGLVEAFPWFVGRSKACCDVQGSSQGLWGLVETCGSLFWGIQGLVETWGSLQVVLGSVWAKGALFGVARL